MHKAVYILCLLLLLEYLSAFRLQKMISPAQSLQSRRHLTASDIDAGIESWYTQCSQTIKCPFFKRRFSDFLDATSNIFQFILARHKSILPLSFIDKNFIYDSLPPGCKSLGENKQSNLSMQLLTRIIEKDWATNVNTNDYGKGYYITGKLSRSIYRDDCLFDGPDPDMPVRGLRKYLAASSQLFERKESTCELLDIHCDEISRVVSVRWKLQGKLNLPWHPSLKPYSGTTHYYIDEDGMVEQHLEEWDISMLNAFVSTLFPYVAKYWFEDTSTTSSY